MTNTIKSVKEQAKKANKKLTYNRATGMYHIGRTFLQSEGEIPFRDENGNLGLEDYQLNKLASYI